MDKMVLTLSDRRHHLDKKQEMMELEEPEPEVLS
jgi:hypothetical protein